MSECLSGTTVLGHNGRIVIPAKVRKQLGLKPGMVLDVKANHKHMVVEKPANAWEELRAAFEPVKWQPGQPLASKELIAERRAEAARENI